MSSPANDTAELLESSSMALSLSIGTNLFIGREPDSPADCVTIFDTPGGDPMLVADRLKVYQYPAIQIRIRDINYMDGMALADDIVSALHGLSGEVVNGWEYTLFKCLNGPFLLDWTENNRARIIVNFSLQRKPS